MTDIIPHSGPRPVARHAWLREARELLRLAVPLAATQLAQMIILATDTVMLGHFSKAALAAAAIGNTVYFMIWLLGSGVPMAVSPVIAHAQGAYGDRAARRVRLAVRMGLWSVALVSLPLMAILFLARPILIFLHQDAVMAGDAALFCRASPSDCLLHWDFSCCVAFQRRCRAPRRLWR